MKKSLPYIDYFCTWFSYDFELLNKYFDSNLKFKYFKYLSPYKDTVQNDKISFCSKEKDLIMVNHQASLTGNYITLFRKLKSLKGIGILRFVLHSPMDQNILGKCIKAR